MEATAAELDEVRELAIAAGELTLRWFGGGDIGLEHKGDGSPVTRADRAAEAFLREQIARRHPDDAILGEEEGATAGRSGRTWIIDPIDGTKSFVRGVPLYSTLLALVDEHGPRVGAVAIPALGEHVVAGRSLGCWSGNRRCQVSSVQTITTACITSSAYEQPWWPGEAIDRVTASGAVVRTWGDGYGYVLVATGRAEVMIDGPMNAWDIAPMLVVIPEAGGRITTWDGASTLTDAAWIASNGYLHEQVRSLLI
jgi:histidinol phosphatase-like enzyme (inositol monophosphatase family)